MSGTGTAPGGGANAALTGSKLGITLAAMCGALMAILDISIVNVALSDIRASFGTPLDQIAWVSTGYMMANIVVIPMTGWFQRRFGFKRYFTFSILLFTLASALCGLAWNLPSLVMFRVLQGMGGGAIIPTAQSILFARYPREEHGMAGALFGLGAVTGPLLGPTVGGYLIEIASWHWIFLINVPVGIAATALAWRHLDQPGYSPPKESIDKWGIALLAVGMATLQYVLEEGNREDWFESQLITVLAVIAGISLFTFIIHELETPHPVVDLRVFKNRSYTASTILNFLIGLTLFSSSYLFSLYCGAVMRYSALDIGTVFLAAGFVQLFLMPMIGKMSGKLDPRRLMFIGIVLVSISMWLTAHLTNQAGFWDLVRPRMVMSIGLGFLFVPLSMVALSDLPLQQRGNATGLFNLTRELGGSIGTAFMSVALDRSIKMHALHLRENVTPYNPLAMEQVNAIKARFMGQIADPLSAAYAALQGRVAVQAMIRSFNESFLMVSILFVLSLLLLFWLKRPGAGVKIEGAH